MKSYILILIAICVFSFTAGAQSNIVTANLKVFGNCEMCKKRIETALDHRGIKKATWNVKTKNLEVVFNQRKISELEIHELVAAAGNDTEKVKAKDDVYASLPFCCLYRDNSGDSAFRHTR